MKYLIILLLLAFSFELSAQTTTKYSSEDLTNWKKLGIGNAFVSHKQFFMEETEGSKGFMILSPDVYEDVVLSYEIMTLNAATVLVTLLNASDIGSSTKLTIKENSDNFGFWTKEAEDYMFGYRVMAHNSTPFLRKHPAVSGKSTTVAQADKDIMHSGWRHKIECGKKGKRVWLKIDDEIILDYTDDKPLQAGKLAIRVRGTANELGKCMLRNLNITGEKVD